MGISVVKKEKKEKKKVKLLIFYCFWIDVRRDRQKRIK